jgi:hypothetical protein
MSKVERLFYTVVKAEAKNAQLRRGEDELEGYYIIDLPRGGLELHGTSVAIKNVDDIYDVEGDIVFSPELVEELAKELKEISPKCRVVDIHEHEFPIEASHVHFKCGSLSEKELVELLKFIRWF